MKPRTSITFLTMLSAISFVGGCGCGDRVAVRQLQITQLSGYSAESPTGTPWPSFDVDTSQIPPADIERVVERRDGCGNPTTEIKLSSNSRLKIIIVPIDHPTTAPGLHE